MYMYNRKGDLLTFFISKTLDPLASSFNAPHLNSHPPEAPRERTFLGAVPFFGR